MSQKRKLEEDDVKNVKKKSNHEFKTFHDYFQVPKFTTLQEYKSHFGDIASHLLNNTVLYVAGEECRLGEIEFYYFETMDGCVHADPFCHKAPIQKTYGKWYFHQMSNGSYKGGTYKGIDFTIGNENAFGGILIRSIQEIRTGRIIDGPCLVVNYILEMNGVKDIAEFVNTKLKKYDNGIFDHKDLECCFVEKSLFNKKIYPCARVGLSLKQYNFKDQRLRFLLKEYRFLTFPSEIKKGKHQMVISHYHGGDKSVSSIQEMSKLFKMQQKTIEKCVESFRKKKDPYSFFGNAMTGDQLCEIASSLLEYF